jgi:diguanylate cyclase (GGDEF)-like protein
MLGSVVRANRVVVQSLHLRRENAQLLANVTAEKAAMELLNRQLQAAIAERENAEHSLRETNRSLEQRVQARTLDLERLANYDALTRLPNRLLLKDRLQHAIASAGRERRHIAILFLDLDHFKLINDSLGHDAGDELLQAVAVHLQTCVRQSDTVARIGGDEFVIVLERLTSPDQAQAVADKILNLLRKPITIQGQAFFIGCSIGISQYPEDGGNSGVLLKHADIALQRAKAQGRNLFCCYTASMNADIEQRVGLESELRQALLTGALTLYYQPVIDLNKGTVSGLEALLRWPHPQRGLIPASMLIPLAEETGLIVPIGNQVLTNVCRQIKSWQAQGIDVPTVSVNLSARQFLQADLVEQIENILAAVDLPPACIELEITETMLMQNVGRACDILQALKEKGLLLAIDDFGTGYSSLNYLKRFPLDWLKIDKTFVQDITSDPHDAAIVTAVIALAHNLGLQVVVEGVETDDQLRFVREHASDAAQGYLFSPPLPGDAIPDWLCHPPVLPLLVRQWPGPASSISKPLIF